MYGALRYAHTGNDGTCQASYEFSRIGTDYLVALFFILGQNTFYKWFAKVRGGGVLAGHDYDLKRFCL